MLGMSWGGGHAGNVLGWVPPENVLGWVLGPVPPPVAVIYTVPIEEKMLLGACEQLPTRCRCEHVKTTEYHDLVA